MRWSVLALSVMCSLLHTTSLVAQAEPRVTPLSLSDTSGRLQRVFPAAEGQTTVVVFVSTGCPIANSYAPTWRSLANELAGQPVRFIAVHANDEPREKVAAHAQEYGIPFAVLLDPERRAARMLGAKVTPEAFVVDAAGQVRYGGRIDDRWASRTSKKDEPSTRELADAVGAVLAGERLAITRTEAFGCAIAFPERAASRPAVEVSYHEHVAPILQRRCQECHRKGQVAPFELMSYDDARSWGEEIVTFTQSGIMPPWKGTSAHATFRGDRRLTQQEKDTLAAWVRSGTPEGDAKKAPPARAWRDGWKRGEPDLVIEMPEPYTIAAAGRDEYVCFVIPLANDEELFVSGVEFQPGNRRVVHHIIAYLDASGRARELDRKDQGPGYKQFGGGGPGFLPSGGLGGWAPGNDVVELPEGVAHRVAKGSDVVLQVHYFKTGKQETDRSRIGLWFEKGEVKQHFSSFPVVSRALRIPAGAPDHVVTGEYTLPVAADVLSLMPHMHLLGRKIALTAALPDGKRVELIRVDDWDFNWQLTYTLERPIRLPAGTRVRLEAHYDNSAANPKNPNTPPRLVRWGEKTSDEMCIVFVGMVFPDMPKLDLSALRGGLRRGR